MAKGSSVLLPGGLGLSMQILPKQKLQQQAPQSSSAVASLSTSSSHCHSFRPVHQHFSLTTRRQQVRFLDLRSQNGIFFLKDFCSSFHGDAGALKQQKPLHEKKMKGVRTLSPIIKRAKPLLGVQSSSGPFNESHRRRGSYPLLGTETSTAPEPEFPVVNFDQKKTRFVNSPGSLDRAGSSSALVFKARVYPKEVPKGSISLEQRKSLEKEESTYDQRAPSPNSARRFGVRIVHNVAQLQATQPRANVLRADKYDAALKASPPQESTYDQRAPSANSAWRSGVKIVQNVAQLEASPPQESTYDQRAPSANSAWRSGVKIVQNVAQLDASWPQESKDDQRASSPNSAWRSGVKIVQNVAQLDASWPQESTYDQRASSPNSAWRSGVKIVQNAAQLDASWPQESTYDQRAPSANSAWRSGVKIVQNGTQLDASWPQESTDDQQASSPNSAWRSGVKIVHNVAQMQASQPRARVVQAVKYDGARLEASPPQECTHDQRSPSPNSSWRSGGKFVYDVAELEASPPRGASKWTEAAAKIIEQNRNPSHRAGAIETPRQNTDSLTSEFERARDIPTANLSRSSTANEVLRFNEPKVLPREEDGQFGDIFEGGVSEISVRQDVVTEKLGNLGAAGHSQQANLRNETENEKQQWLNADVLVVNNVAIAEAVVEKLRGQYKDITHACDTEVSHIDVKKESPVGHGRMICFSVYCGPETDFGGGRCRLWVDVLDKPEVLEVFKSYFEDPMIRKVWHNYSFDKHILANHGINTQGFYADTMHLARLYDSARTVAQGGYSLEGLTSDKYLMGSHWGELKLEEESGGKRSMKHLFGKPNIKKNGDEGKLRVVPPVEELQTQPEWQDKWIHYSSFDTVCTWCLWSSLKEKLRKKDWLIEGKFIQRGKSMYDFYLEYVQPFGELLVQMEAEGMMLDREHLAKIEAIAIEQQEFAANRFKKWAAKRCPDAIYMNVGSDAQIRQLLFGGKANKNDPDKRLEMERIFNAPNTENYIEEGKKVPKKTRPFTLRGLGVDIPVDTYTSGGWPAVGGDVLKDLAGKVSVDYNMLVEEEPTEDLLLEVESGDGSAVLTSTGVQGGSDEDLSVYGEAYEGFGGGRDGKEACIALAALCEVASINTLISNFIQPLQGTDIKGPDGRIHCSLNINTETGRLSARRPSLQNQPALEKDRYKIRQAFVAAPGKSLIVADYGQLELRILAHLTDCKSMLKAFSDGGDFHSRTAMNMYAHVRNAVERGDVILEWEPKPGEKKPPVPLLKDVFGAERRKAKMLNFSIAYGKTAMGLSKDWKVSLDEAKSTVELWYSDRQEVLRWQQERIREAGETHHVHTLLGRTRHFPDVESSSRLIRGHIERAAINTPVQGSAADVAMCAMLEINRNKILQDLGWRLLLQVHDEVILEGPSESAAVAKDAVVHCMGFPFRGKNNLRVALAVDAKFAQSWYAAK